MYSDPFVFLPKKLQKPVKSGLKQHALSRLMPPLSGVSGSSPQRDPCARTGFLSDLMLPGNQHNRHTMNSGAANAERDSPLRLSQPFSSDLRSFTRENSLEMNGVLRPLRSCQGRRISVSEIPAERSAAGGLKPSEGCCRSGRKAPQGSSRYLGGPNHNININKNNNL